jgi:hypothetical protein
MFVAPSGKTYSKGGAVGVARWFIHDFSRTRRLPEHVVHRVPTIGAHDGTRRGGRPGCGSASLPEPTWERLIVAGGDGIERRAGREKRPAGVVASPGEGQRKTPEGTADLVASNPVQAPGRRFRCRGPFRQELRYGLATRLPSPVIHDFRSSKAVLEDLVHRLPTKPVVTTVSRSRARAAMLPRRRGSAAHRRRSCRAKARPQGSTRP